MHVRGTLFPSAWATLLFSVLIFLTRGLRHRIVQAPWHLGPRAYETLHVRNSGDGGSIHPALLRVIFLF